MEPSALSPREREILLLLGDYLTHEQIAQRLVISVRTVESHVASLRRKLGRSDHRDLARPAAREAPSRAGGTELPIALTPFVGRAAELRELGAAAKEASLVSVVGPGGAGKTRLALAAAERESPRAVYWVDLIPITDPAVLNDALAAGCGVTASSRRGPLEALVAELRGRSALLVLDNAEHVVNGVAVAVERLLTGCPDLAVLVTSRVRLALPFERVLRIGGLSAAGTREAVVLFRARAASAGVELPRSDDERIAAICTALDGLPLAIELAAVRLPALGLAGIETGLLAQPGLLAGRARAAARHRSMTETLDWSIALLEPGTVHVLARLAVLVAPFDAVTAGALATFGTTTADAIAPSLAELVEHSLLEATWPSGIYRMLEPIRQYALSRLSAEDTEVFARHRDWCRDVLGEARRNADPWAAARVIDDARAALARRGSGVADRPAFAALAYELGLTLFADGSLREAQARLEQAAALGDDRRAVTALAGAAAVARCRVTGEEALRLDLEAASRAWGTDDEQAGLALARAAETVNRFAGMFAEPPAELGAELISRARATGVRSARLDAAVTLAEAAHPSALAAPATERASAALQLAQQAGDVILQSAARDALTARAVVAADPVTAYRIARERLTGLGPLVAHWPAHVLEVKDGLHMAVLVALGAGELVAARGYAECLVEMRCLRERRDLAEDEIVAPAALAGDWPAVRAAADRYLADWTSAGRPPAPGRALTPAAAALAYGLCDAPRDCARWLAVLARIRAVPRAQAWRGSGFGELFAAMVLLHRDRPNAALHVLRSPGVHGGFGNVFTQWTAAWSAEAAVLSGDPAAADLLAAATRVSAGNPVAEAVTRRARALAAADVPELAAAGDDLAAAGAGYEVERTRTLGRRWTTRTG